MKTIIHKSAGVAAMALAAVMFTTGVAGSMTFSDGNEGIAAGQDFINFTLKEPNGNNVNLHDLTGKVVVLSFWACHADSCFTTARALKEMINKYPKDKLVVVTVCSVFPGTFTEKDNAKLARNCGRGQTILLDPDHQAMNRYHVLSTPTTFVIGPDRVIRNRVEGLAELRDPSFTGLVDSLVNR